MFPSIELQLSSAGLQPQNSYQQKHQRSFFLLITWILQGGREMEFGTFDIEINDSSTSGNIMISHEEWGNGEGGVWDLDLVVRETLGDGDFNIYTKNTNRSKK
jgi:hypothetical protein